MLNVKVYNATSYMKIRAFLILALCVFSSTLGIGIVSPLLPLFLQEMGATGVWLGLIVAAYFISNSICVPIAGRLSDQKGRKFFLGSGLLAYALISLGYIWADNVALLTVVRFFQGIAGAVTIPIAMAYLGDLSPEGEEGRWQGYASAAFFSGFGLGPLLGGVVTEHFSMTAAFLIMSGLNFVAAFIAFVFLPESTRRQTSKEFHLSIREMGASGIIRGLFSFRLAQALGRGGIAAFLPIFASMLGLSTSLIGILLTVNILSVTLLTPLGGLMADRFNRKALTIFGNFFFALVLAVIPLTDNFGLLLGILLIQGLSTALCMPAAAALTVEEGRRFGMGSTMSIFFLAMAIGQAIGPIISGVIADYLSINAVFYTGAILGGIGTLLFIWFTRRYHG